MTIEELIDRTKDLAASGSLLDSTAENLQTWLSGGFLSEASVKSVQELLAGENVEELNNRFYKTIAFGTGGMRGRTIGAKPTTVEAGDMSQTGSPRHPGVGSNMLNEYTVARATLGLFNYAKAYHDREGIASAPRLVIAHDVRHFSRFFCELSASIWSKMGGEAFIFEGPRSTPQLSFSVRHLKATCGIVITASHNPPHDNGYKVYFSDGGQVVPPNDTGIIAEVEKIPLQGLEEFLQTDLAKVTVLDRTSDSIYVDTVLSSVIDRSVFEGSDLKVVFTPIHGTGASGTLPALESLGVNVLTVADQMKQDSNFSTVTSPNPENAEALDMAIQLAETEGADFLMGTDPDCDRMGIAVKGPDGKMVLLTGNQIGAMMAEYRVSTFKSKGWLPKEGSLSAVLIKTFVTSPLQDAIGEAHGIKVVNTLTGFKWIGEKLMIYEKELQQRLAEKTRERVDYDKLSQSERSKLLQEHSSFYVFGGEESYGYLPNDAVRDKDGNAACVIFCELVASLKTQGKTVLEYLDAMYLKYGYYLEGLGQIVYEGAVGAARIARILKTYRENPPSTFLGEDVTKFTDFGRQDVSDPDGKAIPKQDLYFVELANGYRYAVRGSGTEPKIKFYLFGRGDVADSNALPSIKEQTAATLESLKQAILDDARERAES